MPPLSVAKFCGIPSQTDNTDSQLIYEDRSLCIVQCNCYYRPCYLSEFQHNFETNLFDI